MTPYERGMQDGQWSAAEVAAHGFDSAEECLAHQEGVYQEERDKLPRLYAQNPEYAQQHAAYMEGWILTTRETLRRLIESACE
jgi:hypothetical protein